MLVMHIMATFTITGAAFMSIMGGQKAMYAKAIMSMEALTTYTKLIIIAGVMVMKLASTGLASTNTSTFPAD